MRLVTDVNIKFIVIIFFLSTILFTVAGCNSDSPDIGQEFSLRIGESKGIKGEDLQIKFLEVTEDSRCPKDVVCVWEGRVSCLMEITYRESLHQVILNEPGSTNWPPETSFKEYNISYHVEPYPEADTEIKSNEYRLVLVISK